LNVVSELEHPFTTKPYDPLGERRETNLTWTKQHVLAGKPYDVAVNCDWLEIPSKNYPDWHPKE